MSWQRSHTTADVTWLGLIRPRRTAAPVADEDLQPDQRLDTDKGTSSMAVSIGSACAAQASRSGWPASNHCRGGSRIAACVAARPSAGTPTRGKCRTRVWVWAEWQCRLPRSGHAFVPRWRRTCTGRRSPSAGHSRRRRSPLVDAPLGRRRRCCAPRLHIGRAAGRDPRGTAVMTQPRLDGRRPFTARVCAAPQGMPRFPGWEAQAIGDPVQTMRGQVWPVRLRNRRRGRCAGRQRCGHGRSCRGWWESRSPMSAAAATRCAEATCR